MYFLLTLTASTVVLKTGLLCLTLLQYLGLAGLVRLQPYFSRILKALISRLKDSRTWKRGKMNESNVILYLQNSQVEWFSFYYEVMWMQLSSFQFIKTNEQSRVWFQRLWIVTAKYLYDISFCIFRVCQEMSIQAAPPDGEMFTSCLLRHAVFSFKMASTPMWRYFSDRGRAMVAMVWTSAFTSWATPEAERRDWDLILTSSIWTDAGPPLIAVREGSGYI